MPTFSFYFWWVAESGCWMSDLKIDPPRMAFEPPVCIGEWS